MHNYKYDEKASTPDRIVTICSHCGDVRVSHVRPASQEFMWTRPPIDWMHGPGYLRPRLID